MGAGFGCAFPGAVAEMAVAYGDEGYHPMTLLIVAPKRIATMLVPCLTEKVSPRTSRSPSSALSPFLGKGFPY